MPQPIEHPFSVGETQPIHYGDGTVGVATLIEIVTLPDDPVEREEIVTKTLARPKTEDNIAIIAGANLADDPELAPRLDQNALYIFES